MAANSERIIGLEPDGSVPVTIVSGGGTGGTASSFGAAFPATGTAAGFIDASGDMAGGTLDASGYLKVNVAAGSSGNAAASATGAAVPASADYQGVNVAGNLVGATGTTVGGVTAQHVIGSGAAGTAATGVVTVQGIASMTPLLVTPAANSAVNVAQINGVTPLMGAGNTGTGSPRVTIATDQLVLPVGGNVANDAVDSGNPVKIGGIAATAAPTAVAAADRVNALLDLWGRLFTRTGAQAPAASTFTATHVPATTVQATATKASAGAGKRNVCTGFTVTLAAGASAIAAAAPITVAVIDGATGGTTYLWRSYINVPAVAGAQVSIVRTGMWLVGTAATALTIEFSAGGGTNSYESVTMDGVIVEEA